MPKEMIDSYQKIVTALRDRVAPQSEPVQNLRMKRLPTSYEIFYRDSSRKVIVQKPNPREGTELVIHSYAELGFPPDTHWALTSLGELIDQAPKPSVLSDETIALLLSSLIRSLGGK